jgi:hypothetical protein
MKSSWPVSAFLGGYAFLASSSDFNLGQNLAYEASLARTSIGF